jgi:hypothetical protein
MHAALKEHGVSVTPEWLDALRAALPGFHELPVAQQVRCRVRRFDPYAPSWV